MIETLATLGFVRRLAVFAAGELEAASHDIDRLIKLWRPGGIDDADYWACPPDGSSEPSLYRIHRLETKTRWPELLARSDRFREVLEEVFAGTATATQCALTLKMEGAGIRVPWHRDPVMAAAGSVYNFSLYLDEATPENGCLHVLPRSHADASELPSAMPQEAVPVPAQPGDVVIHDVHLQHGSPQSTASRRRRVIVIEYTKGLAGEHRSVEPTWQ